MLQHFKYCLVLSYLLTTNSYAQQALPEATYAALSELATSSVSDNTGYLLVRDLTTEVGQRLAGSEADFRAVQWVKQRFEDLGFDKVWLEPVTFKKWVRGSEQAYVNEPYQQTLHISALGGSVGTDGIVSSEIVMFKDLAALESASADQIKGKIVYVAKRMFKHIQGIGYGHVVVARSKGAAIAEAKGATAFMLRSVGTDSHRFPHTGMMSEPAGIAAVALSNPDADQIERLLAKGQSVTVSLQVDAGFDGEYTSHNVIAEITGSETPEKIVIIGGHLDSWDLGTGAIDDAAGVGITTGAAVQFLRPENRPKKSLRVIAFANEEQGLLGGYAYAEAHKDELQNIVAASESDFGAGAIWSWDTKLEGYDAKWFAQTKNLMTPLGIAFGGNNATSGGPDITPLFNQGAPVFRLNQNGEDYFDLHHTADDTFDKIEKSAFQQNVQAWVAMLGMLLY